MEADAVFHGGRIYPTADPQKVYGALAVVGGRVRALGHTISDIQKYIGPRTQIVDLKGHTVLPGFHDAHCHVLLFGLGLLQVDLRSATSIAQIVQAIAHQAQQTPKGRWIRAWGYNDTKLVERRHPTRADLDPVSQDHPVFLAHISGHICVANSKALQLAGITPETPNPPGGVIERDHDGRPTGVLKEAAGELVKRILPPYTLKEAKEALAAANARFVQEGITAVADAWAGWIVPQEFRAYQEAIAEGRLLVRVTLMPDIESLPVKDGRLDFAWGWHTGFGSDRLRLGAVKIFLDGSLIGRTAYLSEPYASDPATCGLLVKSEERIYEQVRLVHEAGWQVAMHAIGDRAIEVGLKAIERVMGQDSHRWRPRLEHCGIVRPDLVLRLRAQSPIIVTQPHFVWELAESFRWALGERRLPWVYPFRTLWNSGLTVAFSSDRPVVEGAPLRGIEAALCHHFTPTETLSLQQALWAYTQGAAYANFWESDLGTLTEGRWADFVVLEEDPFVTPPHLLSQIPIRMTVIGGEVVYERS
jgi:predicted amidohydrolase YtcJ